MAVIELNKDNFDETVDNNDMVIVDFWAPWCGPCRAFGPTYEKVSVKYPQAIFAKVNTDDERDLAMMFQIRSIPTLMIFREKIVIYSQPGMLPESAFVDLVDKALGLDMEEVKREVAKQQAGG
ncbi:MAG: thioredoxin [Magnetococcales bacterium]|nr:thioredoxin [Magnetococcales bacterium]